MKKRINGKKKRRAWRLRVMRKGEKDAVIGRGEEIKGKWGGQGG